MANASSRAAFLEEVTNSGDIDRFMNMYAENVKFSDFVAGVVEVNKQGLYDYASGFLTDSRDIKFRTQHAYGSDELFIWEVDFTFIAGDHATKFGVKKGQTVVMKGASLMRWENDLIVEERDYFVVCNAN